MFRIITKSAVTTSEKLENTILTLEGHRPCTSLLGEYLGARSLVAFSQTCKTAQRMSYNALLKSLLSAVVCGDEKLAKKIVTAHPELLLDASTTTKDLSGKQITGLTALQAAICAGDVEMVQMVFDVLQHKLQIGINLSFVPELEIQRQFAEIYPEGIDAVEAAQKVQAQAFKDSMLNEIFAVINAAQDEQIQYELNTPGQAIIATEEELGFEQENPGIISKRRRLNVALHNRLNVALRNFRVQVADLSNLEKIFNPFNLLAAFELFDEQFNNFSGNDNERKNKRDLFWRQVVGYIQRHLPACYLQAFAGGIYDIAERGVKLERTFKLRHWPGLYMRLESGDLNNLGYKWAPSVYYLRGFLAYAAGEWAAGRNFSKFIANKKIRFGELTQPAPQRHQPQRYLPTRCALM